jgi:D-lactate dehydrogenase
MALDTKYSKFVKDISSVVSLDRIYDDDLRLLTWGTDAGFYRLLPKLVVRAKNETEIIAILNSASKHNLPVTFRAAGTSLSGQAITDSILVVAGKNWENYRILDSGNAIALQPGIIGGRVNAILQPYHRIFSPDPASKNSAMVGGIVINNAYSSQSASYSLTAHCSTRQMILRATVSERLTAQCLARLNQSATTYATTPS